MTDDELRQMVTMKRAFERQKESLQAHLPALAAKYAAQARALAAQYGDELRTLLASAGVSDSSAAELAAAEDARLAALPALLGSASEKAVLRELAARQFGTIARLEAEKRIVYAQAVVRGWLVRRKFKAMANSVKKRERTARELLETERTYTESLGKMVDSFVVPLTALVDTPKQVVSGGDLKAVFSNCELLYGMHKTLLAKLDERIGQYNASTTRIGDVFIEMGPFFKLYTVYVNNYDAALARLTALKKNNARFATFVLDVQKTPTFGGLDLISFLIMPVQRIPRYEMLLKELVKCTPADHGDYAALEQALANVKAAAQGINEAKRRAESNSKMISIGQSLKVPPGVNLQLFQPHRLFVAEGTLQVQEAATKVKDVVLYLFNDILIVGRLKSSLSITNVANALGGENLRYGDFVQMKKLIKLSHCSAELTPPSQLVYVRAVLLPALR